MATTINHRNADAAEMLSPNEAAYLIGVESHTLAVWRMTGRYSLPFTRAGKAIRYRRSDVLAWIERRTGTSLAAVNSVLATA